MQAKSVDISIQDFKNVIDEECTEENGWKSVYEGALRKDYPDSSLKIFKKKAEGETVITLSIEGTIKGVKPAKFFRMLHDPECMKKAKPAPKEFKIIEKISDNSDAVYIHMPLPFPMSDRDFVYQRLYLNNKDHAKLVKQLGLYDKKHKYYVLAVKSVERDDCPLVDKLVRAEIKMNYWLIEEIPGEKNAFKFRTKVCQALNGKVPLFVVNDLGPKMSHKMMGEMLDNYKRIYEEEEKK